jgi:alkyl sulfatase BDS1-like metallo-beta-lactamase superfamily hydrolase
MGKVRDFAEKMWSGDQTFSADMNPLALFAGLEQLDDGLAFMSSFSNITALLTDAGMVLIDTGAFMTAQFAHQQIRSWSKEPVHTAVYTHGHVDHAFGLEFFEREAKDKGWTTPHVIAHELLPPRFDRYKLTAGYNEVINARQFRVPGIKWPTHYRYPDQTYRNELTVEVGGVTIELYHERGETDDHTWAWIPSRKVICTGDLFIWAAPNCGNPQKVQRYPREWARALRAMEALGAETLLPGHGPPIFGADRVKRALDDTAQLLSTIHDQTLAMMNDGARLDDIMHSVDIPEALLQRPYLRPVYDDPAFIIRNIWRLYGGWYDGNPAHLKPARDADVARELAAMVGGAAKLAARATELAEQGDVGVATQLVEYATQAAPEDAEVVAARKAVYTRCAEGETSLMARSIYRAAAED